MQSSTAQSSSGSVAGSPAVLDARLLEWRISPFCVKVRLAAAVKGLSFGERVEASLDDLKAARARTGVGKVPHVIAGDRCITDSTDIAVWLEELSPSPSLYPESLTARAEHDLLEDWADEGLNAIAEPLLWADHLPALVDASVKAASGAVNRVMLRVFMPRIAGKRFGFRRKLKGGRAALERQLAHQLDMLERRLGDRPWLFDQRPTLADCAIIGQLRSPLLVGLGDLQERPRLVAYLERGLALIDDTAARGAGGLLGPGPS